MFPHGNVGLENAWNDVTGVGQHSKEQLGQHKMGPGKNISLTILLLLHDFLARSKHSFLNTHSLSEFLRKNSQLIPPLFLYFFRSFFQFFSCFLFLGGLHLSLSLSLCLSVSLSLSLSLSLLYLYFLLLFRVKFAIQSKLYTILFSTQFFPAELQLPFPFSSVLRHKTLLSSTHFLKNTPSHFISLPHAFIIKPTLGRFQTRLPPQLPANCVWWWHRLCTHLKTTTAKKHQHQKEMMHSLLCNVFVICLFVQQRCRSLLVERQRSSERDSKGKRKGIDRERKQEERTNCIKRGLDWLDCDRALTRRSGSHSHYRSLWTW